MASSEALRFGWVTHSIRLKEGWKIHLVFKIFSLNLVDILDLLATTKIAPRGLNSLLCIISVYEAQILTKQKWLCLDCMQPILILVYTNYCSVGLFFLRLQIFSCHKSEVKTKVAECVLIICNLIYQLVILVLMMVMMMLPNTNVFWWRLRTLVSFIYNLLPLKKVYTFFVRSRPSLKLQIWNVAFKTPILFNPFEKRM